MTRLLAKGAVVDIDEILGVHAQTVGERAALVEAGERSGVNDVITFEHLRVAVRMTAALLAERYPPGSRIMLSYPQGVGFAPAFLGCVTAGMVAVPVPGPEQNRQHALRLSGIARDAGAQAVLTESSCAEDAEAWVRRGSTARIEVTATDPWWRDLISHNPRPNSLPDLPSGPHLTDERRIVLLQYTSGSTTTPKGVMVSVGNLFSNLHAQSLILGHGSVVARRGGWIPQYHDMGLIGHLLPGLLYGTGYVTLSATAFLKRPARWLQVMDEFGIGISAAPNFGYEYCTRRVTDEEVAAVDLSRWEIAVNGSEPVHGATMRRFSARFSAAGFRPTTFAPAYGLAESTLIVTGTAGRPPASIHVETDALAAGKLVPMSRGRELTSSGRSANPDRVAIVDPVTRQVSPGGRVGEVWVRGSCVAAGYWAREPGPDDFAAYTADGHGPFLRTGDLGGVLGGELYITGRRKETLIWRGRTLYPQDLENELRRNHPELADCVGAVFSLPVDGGSGESALGSGDEPIIVSHEVRGVAAAEQLNRLAIRMRATVTKEFGVYAAGIVLLRPNTVLRTTSGKIRRNAMREAFLTGELKVVCQRLDDLVRQLMSHPPVGAVRQEVGR